MCGLIGVIRLTVDESNKSDTMVDVGRLEDAMIESSIDRGGDAWGLMYSEGITVMSYKTPQNMRPVSTPHTHIVPSSANFSYPKFHGGLKKDLSEHGTRWVCGHTRFATNGDASDNSNNHPHCGGGWMVMHNGIISNRLATQKTQCDSEAILKMLIANMSKARNGKNGNSRHYTSLAMIRNALKDTWRKVKGSARILVANVNFPSHVWALSDSSDPLWMTLAISETNVKTISIGSTKEHSRFAMETYTSSKEKGVTMLDSRCEPNVLYELRAYDDSCTTSTNGYIKKIGKPIRRKSHSGYDWFNYKEYNGFKSYDYVCDDIPTIEDTMTIGRLNNE